MNRRLFLSLAPIVPVLQAAKRRHNTEVAIRKDGFLINGRPTYRHRTYQARKVEGLLMNERLVQGIFDDLNPETRNLWVYPDTGKWDPERNTTEFLAALREWRQNGVLAFTINLQGGTPGPGVGRASANPTGGARVRGPQLENSALDPEGNLRSAYMARLARILDHADELGMVVILGYFTLDRISTCEMRQRCGVASSMRRIGYWMAAIATSWWKLPTNATFHTTMTF